MALPRREIREPEPKEKISMTCTSCRGSGKFTILFENQGTAGTREVKCPECLGRGSYMVEI